MAVTLGGKSHSQCKIKIKSEEFSAGKRMNSGKWRVGVTICHVINSLPENYSVTRTEIISQDMAGSVPGCPARSPVGEYSEELV